MATLGALALVALALWPSLAEAQCTEPAHDPFTYNGVTDTSVMLLAAGTGAFSQLALNTGELVPQEPQGIDRLGNIDRWVARRDPIESAGLASDLGVASVIAFALADVILDRTRRCFGRRAWGRMLLYFESAAINWGLANLAKIAFRRPRPIAYREFEETGEVSESTNSALSFYSLHTAMAATLASTATYLAISRGASRWKIALTASFGVVATVFVGIERMLSLSHFTTDVLAGALVGTAVGMLVPHLHRSGVTFASDGRSAQLSWQRRF